MSDERDEDREAILARRRRFLGIALGGIALAATACGDDSSDTTPMPCLSPAIDASDPADGGDRDAAPMVCLSRLPPDSGTDGGESDGGESDGGASDGGSTDGSA